MFVQIRVAGSRSMAVVVMSVGRMSSVHLRVMSMTNVLHVGFKTIVTVRLVVNHALGSVGLMQRVLSLDDIG